MKPKLQDTVRMKTLASWITGLSSGTKNAAMWLAKAKAKMPNAVEHAEGDHRRQPRHRFGARHVAGADVLADQRRGRHGKSHRRNDHEIEHIAADAIGRGRHRAEAGDQEHHHRDAKPARRALDRRRIAQIEGALDEREIGLQLAQLELNAVAPASSAGQSQRPPRRTGSSCVASAAPITPQAESEDEQRIERRN